MVVANLVFSVPLMPLRLIRKHQWHLPKEDEDRLLPAQMFVAVKCVLSDFQGGPHRLTVCLNLASSTSGQPLSLN